MDTDLAQQAIKAALSGNWDEALGLNKKIIKENPSDADALNRLARAYTEVGNLTKAKATAQKVLKIDPFNTIASKSLSRWKGIKKGESFTSRKADPEAFLEEPGKTKIVNLLYLGDSKLIAKLDAGDEVFLSPHAHRVNVTTENGKYIGRLPDDLAARLRNFIKAGSSYQAFVKSVASRDVKVFIKEIKRAENLGNIPSFPTEKIDYVAFTPPELVHKKDEEETSSPEESTSDILGPESE